MKGRTRTCDIRPKAEKLPTAFINHEKFIHLRIVINLKKNINDEKHYN